MKKMKTEREPANNFLILPLFFVQYLMTQIRTKKSKGYVSYQ